ncbi:MAG: hypothetical protein IH948_02270, partial [Bacteroidetes bacterium]|nr:hypothetical protein [Bacteroidota bacterium]
LTSPFIDLTALSTPYLEFYYHMFGIAIGDLFIDVWNGSTWNTIDSLKGQQQTAQTDAWMKRSLDISVFSDTIQIRFRAVSAGVSEGDISLDDIVVIEVVTCPGPSMLLATNITGSEADLGWTENGSATLWDIEIGATGFVPTGTPTNSGTGNPFTATGLTGNTTYDFYVRSDCGGGDLSAFMGPFTFTTLLNPGSCGMYTMDLIDTFGDGWNGGTVDIYINGILYTGGVTILGGFGPVTTQIPVDTGDTISFDYIPLGYPEENEIYVYNEIGNLIASEGLGATIPNDIGDYTVPTGLIGCPSCPGPSVLTSSNITKTTADLSWTENGSAALWDIEWGITGFTPGTGTVVSGVTNPYTLTGLSNSTNYDYYVNSDCGGGDLSVVVGPAIFTTTCDTITAPWVDNVEAHITPAIVTSSQCWSATASNVLAWQITGTGTTPSPGTGPLVAYSGNNFFFTEASTSVVGDTAMLTSPAIDITGLTTPYLEFYYHMFGVLMGDLFIEVWNGGSWTTIDSIKGQQQTVPSDGWIKKSIDISAFSGTVNIRFTGIGNGDFEGDISLDNISVIEAPTCPDPSMLNTSNITGFAADLGWVENGSATNWEIEWGVGSFVQGSGTSVITASNPYNLAGLTPGTLYNFYVRAICTPGDTSSWTGSVGFTTLIPCPEPSGLNMSNITASTADADWLENGTATLWDIEWGLSGFIPTGIPTIAGTTNKPYGFTGLTSNTSYDVYLRSDCGGVNGVSTWIGPSTFTTLCGTTVTPWLDDVESHAAPAIVFMSQCWIGIANGVLTWQTSGSGTTTSPGTGPLVANSGNNFFFTEASGSVVGDTAILISPIIDISGLTIPYLEFYYHMFGNVMGDLFIEVWNGSSWITVDSIKGQQQTAQTDAWIKKSIDLSSFSGLINISFTAVGNGAFEGDISVDDIEIIDFILIPVE